MELRGLRKIVLGFVLTSVLSCGTSQRAEPPTTTERVVTPPPEAAPWAPPPGAVFNVTVALGELAPAGLLDEVAALRLSLSTDGESIAQMRFPIPSQGTWVIPDVSGAGELHVALLSPTMEIMAENAFRTGTMAGMIGRLRFEISPDSGALHPCDACSTPALLSTIRRFRETGLYYSAGGRTVTEEGDVLRVALRGWIDDEAAGRIARGAGGVLRAPPVDLGGLRWIDVEPGARPTLEVAMALANESGVLSVGW